MANEARYCFIAFVLGLIVGISGTLAIGYYGIYKPAIDRAGRELVASRADALEYRDRAIKLTGRINEVENITSRGIEILGGAIGTLREAIATVQRCRGVILDIRKTLQVE